MANSISANLATIHVSMVSLTRNKKEKKHAMWKLFGVSYASNIAEYLKHHLTYFEPQRINIHVFNALKRLKMCC